MKEEFALEKGLKPPKACNCNMRDLMKNYIRWVTEFESVKYYGPLVNDLPTLTDEL